MQGMGLEYMRKKIAFSVVRKHSGNTSTVNVFIPKETVTIFKKTNAATVKNSSLYKAGYLNAFCRCKFRSK